ncbi:MAG: hypothetical protein CMP76_02760 [Flavobacterium sp.]|uniref:hypothetical protein n=1 Tax=Flavobacterium sp. TaxID=239 RepID=UPI000C4E87C4|nr:hypothetical protein [Flavobacterium sp.]MBF02197.1 hypothetical protein [Flavobacterium sp.]|tara:strand:+ start:2118 stop:2612 length:495 start_codon:yes stop_codon:yes gene_type:complete
MEATLEKITSFLSEIGISLLEKELTNDTFLPGLALSNKGIEIDYNKLLYPGDILHEAGHLAVTTAEDREKISTPDMPQEWPTQGDEIGAMLWSYAAAIHLEIPLDIVFHSNGYKGSSEWLIQSYKENNFIGLPLLEWFGLTYGPEKAIENNVQPFPHMIQWIRK